MASWGSRQQAKYILTIISLAIVLAAYPVYRIFFDKQPTCFDGIKNQNETGLDCGGVCLKICEAESIDPIVRYTRIFQVSAGVYSVVADIENPNAMLLAENVAYRFRIYDQKNILIAERDGFVFIPPNKIFPIFEGAVKTGNSLPARISFEFKSSPVWRKTAKIEPALNVLNEDLFTSTSTPQRLDAMLENTVPYDLSGIEVVALLHDGNGNVIAASKTLVDSLPRNGRVPLIFTWPQPFDAPVTKIDILPNIPLKDFIPSQQ